MMTASEKVHLPFDRLMALSKAEGPFDRPFDKLTVLSKVEGLCCAASFVIAAYFSVRFISQDLRALHLDLFSLPSDSDFLRNH
jgi:hypothetical protein